MPVNEEAKNKQHFKWGLYYLEVWSALCNPSHVFYLHVSVAYLSQNCVKSVMYTKHVWCQYLCLLTGRDFVIYLIRLKQACTHVRPSSQRRNVLKQYSFKPKHAYVPALSVTCDDVFVQPAGSAQSRTLGQSVQACGRSKSHLYARTRVQEKTRWQFIRFSAMLS